MKRLHWPLCLFFTVLSLMIPPSVLAVPHISLGVVDGTYVGESDDPWITESTVTESGTFTLEVLIGSQDLTGVTLIVAVPEGQSGTVSIDGTPLTGVLSGQPDNWRSPHGIYDTDYYLYPIGDLDSGEQLILDVEWDGYSMVHFDAFGYSNNPHSNHLWNTPDSHDVTATPEPATLMLVGSGLAGLGWMARRKKGVRQ